MRGSSRYFGVLLVTGAVLFAGPQPASAQGDDVPREFVNVLFLLSGWDGANGTLHIGVVPERFHGVLPARGERVVGTLERRSTATAAIAARGTAADVHAAWERRLEAAGWTPQTGQPGMEPRGFVQAQQPARAPTWCWPADSASIGVRTLDAPGDETYVLLSHTPGPSGLCGPHNAGPPMRSAVYDALPALPAPPGATVLGTGGGSDGVNVRQSARVFTSLEIVALLDHYSRHMREQGWEPVDEAVAAAAGMTVWRRAADTGPTNAWITATRLPGGVVMMEINAVADGGE